jgi:acetolactate decarboxylase
MSPKTRLIFVAAILLIIVVSSVFVYEVWPQSSPEAAVQRTLFQISPFNTFSQGNYRGYVSFAEVAKHGDFGIGTLDGLNGEMVALNGVFYQIPSSGVPRQIGADEETPYVTVTFFQADKTIQVPETLNYSAFVSYINGTLTDHNAIYAIKVHGAYDSAKTRSPPQQTEPYPDITSALKNQAVFNLSNVSGTAVGFYFPNSMNGVDFAGFHLHFITDDRGAGGHLLDCTVSNATVEIEQINNYNLKIP